MADFPFLIRSPLLGAGYRILGYELSWHSSASGLAGDDELLALLDFSASQLVGEEGWKAGDLVFFFEATPAILTSDILKALPPAHTVLRLTATDLSDADTFSQAKLLRQAGYGISLSDADSLVAGSPLLVLLTHAECELGVLTEQAALFREHGVQLLVRRIGDWQTCDTCLSAGLPVFVDDLQAVMPPMTEKKGMNATQSIIVQLMDMVRRNADVRQLEEILKRDAALSYKLFRYINSASFGLGVEIQSMRHAVTMLGYSALYRWLSLLLASVGDQQHGAWLMHTALMRGRIAELAGHGILPKAEQESLFVAGMFSLLDHMLSKPMVDVLASIHLSDGVSQALLARDGVYGPFLSLAEACEQGGGEVEKVADSLFIGARQINEAHLAALIWVQKIKI